MEHIIQFAVGIDDNAIRDSVTKNAEKQIIQSIERQVRNRLFESNYYGRDADEKSRLNGYSEKIIENFFEKHKAEIIEKAAVHLADKLARTKAGKALLGEMTDE